MKPLRVALVRMAYGGMEASEVFMACLAASAPHPLVAGVRFGVMSKYGTHVARNRAVKEVRDSADVLVMMDHDMAPHLGFFRHAVEFLACHPGPVVIGSPYCHGEPDYNVLVGKDVAGPVSRHYAAQARGDESVAWVGAGYLAANMAAFDAISKPYFDYVYEDEAKDELSRVEDQYFCEKLTAAGGQVYVAWDYWSGHRKAQNVGKPVAGPSGLV